MPTIKGNGPKPAKGLRRLFQPLKPLYLALPLALRRHLLHYKHHRTWGNFRQPRTYNEKVQWRILNDRRAWIGMTSDKLASKAHVRQVAAATGLPINVPETYWIGTDPRELRALQDRLPGRWVFKPNHSCGRFRIYDSDDQPVDWEDLIAVGDAWMKRDEEEFALGHFGYSLARKLLFAEQRIGAGDKVPATCRSHGVNGATLDHIVSIGSIASPATERGVVVYDANFRISPGSTDVERALDNANSPFWEMPREQSEELNTIIAALTKDFDFLRIDYYWDNGEFWFGEYSPYSGSGLRALPPERDRYRSAAWTLPDLSIPDTHTARWRELLSATERGTLQDRGTLDV